MKVQFVQTENVKKLNGLVDTLLNADSGEPRIGLVYGPAGRGKTKAVDRLATMTGACYVSAARVWTPASMLKSILAALGQAPAWSATDNLNLAADALRERLNHESLGNGLLIVDEGDYLCKGTKPPNTPELLDTIRDLHDASGAPILLVGMADLAKTLSMFPQFWDRLLVTTQFAPLTTPETTEMARRLADLELGQDVVDDLVRATGGNLRQTILYLVRLRRRADANSGQAVTRDWVLDAEKAVTTSKQRAALRSVK